MVTGIISSQSAYEAPPTLEEEPVSPTVIQVPLEVPPEIMEGIQRGIYNLIGGVVRNLDGTIVKLLDDAAPADAAEHVATALR